MIAIKEQVTNLKDISERAQIRYLFDTATFHESAGSLMELVIYLAIYTRASTLLTEWLRYFTSQVSDCINSLEASSLSVWYRLCDSLLGIWGKSDMNRLRICVVVQRSDFITVFEDEECCR